ncbi:MAG TPA: restriction endonuclease [Niabella sp.]|nr:restriction endonuclease [Niabella sp.]
MRNPKWHRDEIILALDLYFDVNRGSIDARNPKVIALSETLNKLPLFSIRPDEKRFRNPNGVCLKLSNFSAIDPDYIGKGMKAYSKLDKKLFDEFYNDRQRLKQIAHQIRQGISSESL